ncbi:HlyC/CorC family transporter [Rhodococcus sp. KBS0724]|jgi:CBS domain containing-hemolysin-like protein|uniref:hemolysin family protein n=1 Tax=Rhodococcus sp. KBS0724 TaxID=1179674 RepID=UPI00110DB5F9|nr:hemolysin family protein [Rhodococcus sp. KBS0724]TSD47388.1 HlyC/CorC family transporter [Rhodococcus sp. KBS0724]
MDNPWIILSITVALIALSAFFVAVEFALISAKRHRLEDAAPNSRAARAALRSSSELTVLLAGSQLGITICTLALGAITKPAVHHWLTPAFSSWGMPLWVADVAGFVLALIIVTFLHLVVGEMAPKSWAIAHPEKSATMLAIPMRGFMWLTRPLLQALNSMANWLLIKVGVQPVAHIGSGQDPAALRHLVEHSANVGALDASYSAQLSGALDMQTLTVRDLLRSDKEPTSVTSGTPLDQVRRVSKQSGHLRILVRDNGIPLGILHVRDTLLQPDDARAADIMRPAFILASDTPVHLALASMRETRNHLAVVTDNGTTVGIITLADVLARLFPKVEQAA